MLFFSFFWLFRPNVVRASHQEESGSVVRYEKSAPATIAQRNVCKSKAALKTVTMTNQ
jgi:hypothetical protein